MSVLTMEKYQAKTFPAIENGLEGLSKEQLEVHFKLYQGYVTNTNTLNEKLGNFIDAKDYGSSEYAELRRRLGFEFDGMRLHEYYFENMKPAGGTLDAGSRLYKKLEEQFGSYEQWEQDFKKTGAMRGIGWAILYQDPWTGRLFNFWIGDHEYGHPAGFQPILVMDVWEHAYTVDWKATERPNYIEAFFKNINWQVVENRLK
jgi:superoxide dismutase, Fe-Mn family